MSSRSPGPARSTRSVCPELTVAAVVETNGRFLMVEERVHGRIVVNQPAGHVEAGETLRAAVIREALEETAWWFEPEAVVGIYLWSPSGDRTPFLRVAFAGRCTRHDAQRPLDAGILRALWLTASDLNDGPYELRSPMVMRAIEDYRRGSRLPCDLIQELSLNALTERAAAL